MVCAHSAHFDDNSRAFTIKCVPLYTLQLVDQPTQQSIKSLEPLRHCAAPAGTSPREARALAHRGLHLASRRSTRRRSRTLLRFPSALPCPSPFSSLRLRGILAIAAIAVRRHAARRRRRSRPPPPTLRSHHPHRRLTSARPRMSLQSQPPCSCPGPGCAHLLQIHALRHAHPRPSIPRRRQQCGRPRRLPRLRR